MTEPLGQKLDALISIALNKSKESFETGAVITFERICAICEGLLRHKVPIDPTYDRISIEGVKKYGEFLKPQSIKNVYRKIILPWKAAYKELVATGTINVSNSDVIKNIKKGREGNALMDALYSQISHLEREVNMLRQVIYQSAPVPIVRREENIRAEVARSDILVIKAWIDSFGTRDSLIRSSNIGLELTAFARPSRTIMTKNQLAALIRICATQ
jgi:hypothetical protein